MSLRSVSVFLARGALACLLACALSGCFGAAIEAIFSPYTIEKHLNPAFSINVVKTPEWWPDDDTFKTKRNPTGEAQRAYYEQWGRPDFIRLIYRKDRTVIDFDTYWANNSRLPPVIGYAWVYLDRKIETHFNEKTGVEEGPLSDEIRMICDEGDPDQILRLEAPEGMRKVRFFYRQTGKAVTFENSRKTGVDQMPALPGWMRGRRI